MLLASEGAPSWMAISVTLLGGTLAIGGAQALNAYIDRDLDRKMERTRNRPLAAGRISPASALVFGITLATVSFIVMGLVVNLMSALLTLGALAYYVIVYSRLLKLRTTQNIVIGGAAGAAPALIGWAAATNELALTPVLLFAVIFFWTPPHSWALALVIRDEYKDAGVPMLPVVAGERAAAIQILIYTLILVPLTLLMVPVASLGWSYGASAMILGGILVALEIRLLRLRTTDAARDIFFYSMIYLALLFGAMVLDYQLGLA
jgi:protoheme IX farnesyltransferase